MSEWTISELRLEHPMHGTFYLSMVGTLVLAIRVWNDAEGIRQHEPIKSFVSTFEAGKEAVAQRIRELDQAVALEAIP